MITSVRLQNFKSFQLQDINLGLRTFLVGPNMAGKSNLIEAFRFLQRVTFAQPGVHGLQNAFTGGFPEFTWKGGQSNLMVIALQGKTLQAPDDLEAKWSYEITTVGDERGSVTVQEERLSLSTGGRTHELIGKRNGNRPLINMDGREVLQSVDRQRAAIEFEIPDWEGSFLRKSIASWRFYRLIPPVMRQPNAASAAPYLTELGDNLSSWLMHLQTRYGDAFTKVKQVCRDVLPDFDDLFTWPTQQATVAVASNEKHLRRPISVWEMSDGELVFVALLSLIFSPLELGAALYCIEEVENYLHPKLIETLLELLKQAQEELGPSNAPQVIATTHSPQVVDKVSLEELIVVEKRRGATVVTYPKDKAHLRELLTSEELGLGDLYYSGALQGG